MSEERQRRLRLRLRQQEIRHMDQTLMAEWHVRYGGRGVMIDWHVERRLHLSPVRPTPPLAVPLFASSTLHATAARPPSAQAHAHNTRCSDDLAPSITTWHGSC